MNSCAHKPTQEFQLMELSASIVWYMLMCTCTAHKQLNHAECIREGVTEIVAKWLRQQLPDLLEGDTSEEDFLQQLLLITRDSTVTCLEKHVSGFDKTK